MHTQRGMTLLEVMMALSVMSIIMLGLVSAFLGESLTNNLTAMETTANNAAQEKLEEVIGMAKQYTTVSDDSGTRCVIRTINSRVYRATYLDALAMFLQYPPAPPPNPGYPYFTVEGLHPIETAPTVDGEACVGEVIVYLNENKIPVELGGDGTDAAAVTENGRTYGPLDLNGDGNFSDLTNPNNAGPVPGSTDTIARYNTDMVPVEVRITYDLRPGEVTSRRFMMVARTRR